MSHRYRVHRHATVAVSLAASASLVLAGCASGGSEDEVAEDGTVTLQLASWLPTPTQWPDMVAMFEEKYPDITIEYAPSADYAPYQTDLDNAILAGETPDIFGVQPGASFEDYAEYALDVEEYAADWIGDLQQATLEQTTAADGTVKAIPLLTAGSEFYVYNQTILDELGLSLPESYDDLVAVSAAATAAGYSPFAMGAADAWHDNDFFVWLSNQYGDGGDVYRAAAGEIPWDSESLVAAATRWHQLFEDGVFQNGATSTTTYPSARDDYFLAGKALAMPTGSWHVGASLSTNAEVIGSAVEGDAIGMAPFPMIGDNDSGVTNGVDFALAVSADIDESKIDAAGAFVQFMATGAGQQYWVNELQGFPVATAVQVEVPDSESDLAKESIAAVSSALAASTYARKIVAPDNPSLETDLGVVLQNIANGADPSAELATLNP